MMKKRLAKGAVILLLLLALIPGMPGCDNREGEVPSEDRELL